MFYMLVNKTLLSKYMHLFTCHIPWKFSSV